MEFGSWDRAYCGAISCGAKCDGHIIPENQLFDSLYWINQNQKNCNLNIKDDEDDDETTQIKKPDENELTKTCEFDGGNSTPEDKAGE